MKVKGDIPCCSVRQSYELDFMAVGRNDVKYDIEGNCRHWSAAATIRTHMKRHGMSGQSAIRRFEKVRYSDPGAQRGSCLLRVFHFVGVYPGSAIRETPT